MYKLFGVVTGVLLIANIGQYYYTEGVKKSYKEEIIEIKLKHNEDIDASIKKSSKKIDSIKRESFIRFDSLMSIPPKKQYIKYEKPIYIDRTFDDAIRIHTEYKKTGR